MNKIFIEGRVAGSPRTGTSGKGKDYLSFSVSDYQGKDYGSQYINVFVSGKAVEWIKVDRGDCVSVTGKLSIKKDEKYGVQVTVFAENVTNWNREVGRFEDSSPGRRDADVPF